MLGYNLYRLHLKKKELQGGGNTFTPYVTNWLEYLPPPNPQNSIYMAHGSQTTSPVFDFNFAPTINGLPWHDIGSHTHPVVIRSFETITNASTFNPTASVVISASNNIKLNPGFSAAIGSFVLAQAGPLHCTSQNSTGVYDKSLFGKSGLIPMNQGEYNDYKPNEEEPLQMPSFPNETINNAVINGIDAEVIVSPIPSLGQVTIHSIGIQSAINSYEIYTLNGQLIRSELLKGIGNYLKINIEDLASATYILKIKTVGNVFVKKIIKE
jgi:hypothetical protein